MRKDVEVRLGPGDRERLEAVLADRNSAQKHAWRARIILATAAGCGTAEIMRRAGVSKPSVWRWQQRFMEAGVAGLLRDKTRKPGKAPVAPAMAARLIELTLGAPPGETTHWTSRAMGKVTGLAISTVQKIWRAHHPPRAPLAPAVSPLGMTWIGMSACSSRWSGMPARISAINHC